METTLKVAQARIANQIALNINEALRRTPYYKHNFKRMLNMFLQELVKCEPEYDAFFNKLEDSTVQTYDVYDAYIKTVASVPIWDCLNITLIIEAYNKDPKSIEGICKKILKV